jgi:PAS domain S-box-containing protein
MSRAVDAVARFSSVPLRIPRVSPAAAYAFAIGISAAATGVRLLLPDVFGAGNWFIQSHPAVLLAAWVGGFGPGVVATCATALLSAFFFVPPAWSFSIGSGELTLVATFVGIGLLMTALVAALRHAHGAALHASHLARAAEQRYRQLMDMTPVGVFVDVQGSVVYANAALGQIVGIAEEHRLLDRAPLDFVDPQGREAFLQWRREVGSRTGGPVHWTEQIWRKADGSPIPVAVTATLVSWAGAAAMQVLVRDISEERAVADERERVLRAAEEANRAKDEFLATLSHELRTPLNAIVGWSHMLATNRLDANGIRQAIEVIRRNAQVQTQLVDDLLDASRIATGSFQLNIDRVDLRQLIDDAIEVVRPSAERKRMTLHVRDIEAAPSVYGDALRLRQALWNLLSNAVKFGRADGTITLTVESTSDRVEIAVVDDGPGIPAEFMPHLFERFRQADGRTTRAVGGMGLGLALVRHIVEAHGGRVHAHSEGPGQGARFTITLPVQRASSEDAA